MSDVVFEDDGGARSADGRFRLSAREMAFLERKYGEADLVVTSEAMPTVEVPALRSMEERDFLLARIGMLNHYREVAENFHAAADLLIGHIRGGRFGEAERQATVTDLYRDKLTAVERLMTEKGEQAWMGGGRPAI